MSIHQFPLHYETFEYGFTAIEKRSEVIFYVRASFPRGNGSANFVQISLVVSELQKNGKGSVVPNLQKFLPFFKSAKAFHFLCFEAK